MGNINKIFKEAVEGYEAPMDASIWENISAELSPLEDAFRDSVEGHEIPYDPSAWSAIKNQIGTSSHLFKWIAGSAAAVTLVAGAIVFIPSNDSPLTEQTAPTAIENNAIVASNDNISTNTSPKTEDFSDLISSVDDKDDSGSHETENVSDENENNNQETNYVANHTPTNTEVDEASDNSTNNESGNDLAIEPVLENDTDNVEEVSTIKYSADFNVSAYEVCAGERLIFNPKVVRGNTIHVWDFGDGTYSSENTATHKFEKAGTYDVILTIRDKQSNRILATSKESITINALPELAFTWEKDNEIIPTVDFINLSEEGQNWFWKVNGRMISDRNEFEYTFREKGIHTVELSATNNNGCSNKVQEQIAVESDYDLFAPTAFSPNGDGQNETFIPKALLLIDKEFTMVVYNQAGKAVFTTQNANTPWDGRTLDNADAPAGSYIWVVSLKNGNGQSEDYQGQFTLIR